MPNRPAPQGARRKGEEDYTQRKFNFNGRRWAVIYDEGYHPCVMTAQDTQQDLDIRALPDVHSVQLPSGREDWRGHWDVRIEYSARNGQKRTSYHSVLTERGRIITAATVIENLLEELHIVQHEKQTN